MSEAEYPGAACQMREKVEELKRTADKTAVSFDARKSWTFTENGKRRKSRLCNYLQRNKSFEGPQAEVCC